jgi:hypothetical protein
MMLDYFPQRRLKTSAGFPKPSVPLSRAGTDTPTPRLDDRPSAFRLKEIMMCPHQARIPGDGGMSAFESAEQEWRAFLMGEHPRLGGRSGFRLIPSGPRCKQCSAPFGPPGAWIMRRLGFVPWEKNPSICRFCLDKLGKGEGVGAEVELSILFADVRGASRLARTLSASEFR